jgi:cell wall-associated NlpC family hydrolase
MPVLTHDDVYRLVVQQGGTPDEAAFLAAVAGPESTVNGTPYTTDAHNDKAPDNSYGLLQINMLGRMGEERAKEYGLSSYDDLYDPATNIRAGLSILRSQGKSAWSTYTSGAYKKYDTSYSGDTTAGATNAPTETTAPATKKNPGDTLESRLLTINSVLGGAPGPPPSQTEPAAAPSTPATPASVPQQSSGVAQTVIDAAKSALGQPYVWGGNDLGSGVDCSGLIQQAFKAAGIDLPRVSNEQARAGEAVPVDQMQPGDILWWDYGAGSQVDGADHVALYLGTGKMIEALHRGEPVHIVDVRAPSGVTRIAGSAAPGSYDPKAKQVEVGPNDSLAARLAAVDASISSTTTAQASGF